MTFYIVVGVSFIAVIFGVKLILTALYSSKPKKNKDKKKKDSTVAVVPFSHLNQKKKVTPGWIVGGIIGLMVFIGQHAYHYHISPSSFGSLAPETQVVLKPLFKIIPYNLSLDETLIISCLLYFISGAIISIFFRILKSQMRIKESPGVRRFGIILSFLPLSNILIVLYSFINPALSKSFPYDLVPNISVKVYSLVNFFTSGHILQEISISEYFFFFIFESLFLLVIIVGILCLSRLAHMLLMVITFLFLVDAIYNLISSSGNELEFLIKNCVIMCYFTATMLFFTNPNVKKQFILKKIKEF